MRLEPEAEQSLVWRIVPIRTTTERRHVPPLPSLHLLSECELNLPYLSIILSESTKYD